MMVFHAPKASHPQVVARHPRPSKLTPFRRGDRQRSIDRNRRGGPLDRNVKRCPAPPANSSLIATFAASG